ncbi:nuclear transport factor 2 family protein [Phytohabitans sp. ZYX-F-186]|uniref:Nuclear transport factor 2 family protein n=1 Tax=Phytohabitans maris TaxID=3071409 RepID=A0ABU0ZEA4_9ACTN|nr:nuclear transport factor 2 family protein [Phytohabitans sp. ZYX-F-186]MDQ7904282.1 nuclear transport factor 2 family protein [Phytohabitans sp. ZYX-F-186]
MTRSRDAVLAYWAAAEARDWPGFAALLADDVVYELPQSRERIRGKVRYLRFNVEYPGDWHLTVRMAVGEERHAATWAHFVTDGVEEQALTFFEFDDAGLIAKVTDFWPEPYDPPAGREHLVERY